MTAETIRLWRTTTNNFLLLNYIACGSLNRSDMTE